MNDITSINEIENTVKRLDFMSDTGAQYKAAVAMQGAEYPEAAIAHIRTAWKRKENNLRSQLTTRRNKPNNATTGTEPATIDIGTEPRPLPTSREAFERLSYMERLWMYHNARSDYDKLTARR